MNSVTLRFLVQYAYDLHAYQVEGGAAWATSMKFDVRGKMDGNLVSGETREQQQKLLRERLQTLLRDRFHLVLRSDSKQLPVWILEEAKGGAKLHPPKSEQTYTMGYGYLNCNDDSMDDLASLLATMLDRPVVNKSGIKDSYSFELKWNPDETNLHNTDEPFISTAIQEQLGLTLHSSRGTTDIIVITSAQLPSSN